VFNSVPHEKLWIVIGYSPHPVQFATKLSESLE